MVPSFSAKERELLDSAVVGGGSGLSVIDLVLHLGVRESHSLESLGVRCPVAKIVPRVGIEKLESTFDDLLGFHESLGLRGVDGLEVVFLVTDQGVSYVLHHMSIQLPVVWILRPRASHDGVPRVSPIDRVHHRIIMVFSFLLAWNCLVRRLQRLLGRVVQCKEALALVPVDQLVETVVLRLVIDVDLWVGLPMLLLCILDSRFL